MCDIHILFKIKSQKKYFGDAFQQQYYCVSMYYIFFKVAVKQNPEM